MTNYSIKKTTETDKKFFIFLMILLLIILKIERKKIEAKWKIVKVLMLHKHYTIIWTLALLKSTNFKKNQRILWIRKKMIKVN